MKNKMILIAAIGFLAIVGCRPNDPKMTNPEIAAVPPPPELKIDRPTTQITANGLVVTYDSRVDILFVIDDSRSMSAHHENLSRNIQAFVDGFAKNAAIDFHIGYVNVWDRLRYGPVVPEVCGPETSTPGFVNWQPAGTLKAFEGAGAPTDGRRYLTSQDPDFRAVLKNNWDPSVNLHLIKDYVDPDSKKPSICAQGPENEESFTPILAALESDDLNKGPNKGFRRKGAFFVAIIVSDAKDESLNYGMTAQKFVDQLKVDTQEMNGGKKEFRVYGVVISPGTKIGRGKAPDVCLPDPAFQDNVHTPYNFSPTYRVVQEGENPIVDAVRLTEDANSPRDGQVLSICQPDFGPALTKFGYQIQQDTLTDIQLELDYLPQVFLMPKTDDPNFTAKKYDFDNKNLKVFIGSKELTEGKEWNYNPRTLTVTVLGQSIPWDKYPNQKIRVSYTPANGADKTTKPLN